MRRELTIVVVCVTALTWLGTAYYNGLPTTWLNASKPFLTAITAAGTVLWLYERYLWSWPIFRGWLTVDPCLSGVWQVKIHSTFVDESTGMRKEPIVGFAQIDQTASSFVLRMFTEESRSVTIAHSFKNSQNVFSLVIVYENRPDISLRAKRSAFHQGSAVFNLRGYAPLSFTGEYWTEHKNTGNLMMFDRREAEIDSYAEGMRLYQNASL